MKSMSSSGYSDNGTVLQRLLAEKYRSGEFKSSCSLTASDSSESSPETTNVSVNSSGTNLYQAVVSNIGVEQIDVSADLSTRSDIHTRIDALWRSTLDTPGQEGTSKMRHQENRGKEAIAPLVFDENQSEERKHCAAQEKLSKMRKELGLDPLSLNSFHFSKRSQASGRIDSCLRHGLKSPNNQETYRAYNFVTSPRHGSNELPNPTHTPGCHSFPSTDPNFPSSTSVEVELHGHPKSNSGGDEYLYTDQLKRNYQRRGVRSKKNKTGAIKSSSFRQTPDESIPNPQTPSAINAGTIKGRYQNDCALVPSNHRSTRSAPSQNSGNDVNLSKLRRSSLHTPLKNLREVTAKDCAIFPNESATFPPSSIEQIKISKSDMHQNHQLMHHTVAAGGSGSFGRPGTNPYLPGLFYAGTCAPSVLNQNTTPSVEGPPSIMSAYGNNSPPRPPPPPYPINYHEKDANLGTNHDIDGESWNLQRPNSLALGNCNKKKLPNEGVVAQNSPCLTSPTNAKCFTPGPRAPSFYNNSKESPYITGSPHIPPLNCSPQQRQTSHGSNSYVRPAANNVSHVATSSSSGSSTVTAATTPAYPDSQSYSDPILRSPPGGYRYQNAVTPVFSQDLYGSGVNKTDSINSASSSTTSGSGVARFVRKKRNSSSKLGFGSANCSGSSSSNSGSRPNSNADLAERLETENESLRIRLESTLQKLRKYESIELELTKINQSHQALQQTANNRERLEIEMRNQLAAKLNQVEKERDDFESQVLSLTKMLKHATTSSAKDNQQEEESKVHDLVGLYEAKNRKLAERERQLQEELEECRERMSEQKSDIARLSTKLQKAQTASKFLQEQSLPRNPVDERTEQLSERLATLQKIVDEREAIEIELREHIRQQLETQRPFKLIPSNDEGISEMDPTEPLSAVSIDIYNSPDGRILGAKAEMLKWKYRYLEHGLLKHVHSNGTESNQQRSVCRALRNHRHAVSDPGFDNNQLMKYLLPGIGKVNYFPTNNNLLPGNGDQSSVQKLKSVSELDFKDGIARYCNLHVNSASKADFSCQTPSTEWSLEETNDSIVTKFRDENLRKDNHIDNKNSAFSGNVVEGDLPSEGYHSQQSSGSPTPNQEKCAFNSSVSRGTLTNSAKVVQALRRNKSADDVLTMI